MLDELLEKIDKLTWSVINQTHVGKTSNMHVEVVATFWISKKQNL